MQYNIVLRNTTHKFFWHPSLSDVKTLVQYDIIQSNRTTNFGFGFCICFNIGKYEFKSIPEIPQLNLPISMKQSRESQHNSKLPGCPKQKWEKFHCPPHIKLLILFIQKKTYNLGIFQARKCLTSSLIITGKRNYYKHVLYKYL